MPGDGQIPIDRHPPYDMAAVGAADDGSVGGQQSQHPQHDSRYSGVSHESTTNDAKLWFDKSNRHEFTTPLGGSAMDVDPPLQKQDASSDDAHNPALDVPLAVQQASSGSFLPPGLVHENSHSSSADDFRSVIDDLTIENKRLKEELKRYKLDASRDVLERDKLFEIKVHGLPRRKKQELEATLRDFAAGLGDSASSESNWQRKREKSTSSKNQHHYRHHHHHNHNPTLQLSAGSWPKQKSSSSSRSRPVDSAYASMSTGAHSSGAPLVRPSIGGQKARTSEQKVERYLQDIPEGLHPYHGFCALGDSEKKKLIVRRLEQLFTGKISGRYARPKKAAASEEATTPAQPAGGALTSTLGGGGSGSGGGNGSSAGTGIKLSGGNGATPVISSVDAPTGEATREARIRVRPTSGKKGGSHDNMSTSHSNSNGEDSGNGSGIGNGNGNFHVHGNHGQGTGNGKQLALRVLPEQRPTRPLDLDPDRTQIPAENMEYIRHLGLVPPRIGPQSDILLADVSPDADGWVYLNLLSNLAQLHILNVTSDFIRQAVVEKSTRFQLSPDGQKIRWRGGVDGTKFSSDGSGGDSSRQGQSTDDGDGSDENGRRKRVKTSGNGSNSGLSNDKRAKSAQHGSGASSNFHYKPLFVHHSPPLDPTTEDESTSQESGQVGDSPVDAVHTASGSAGMSRHHVDSDGNRLRFHKSRSASSSNRNRHKSDGVLVYYSGMPFCTDLAGESMGEASPTTEPTSSDEMQESMDDSMQGRPMLQRSSSGSLIPIRPLTDFSSLSKEECAALGLFDHGLLQRSKSRTTDTMSSSASYRSVGSVSEAYDNDILFLGDVFSSVPDEPVAVEEPVLEASGLNRVFPEDHFSVRVTTKRRFQLHAFGGADEEEENEDGDDDFATADMSAFSMGSLMKRVAALKKQTAPISAAVARQISTKTPDVAIHYASVEYNRREPVGLPQPAMFYSPFSSNSGSDSEDDLVDSDAVDDEGESVLASSSEEMISRRANPHHSDNNPSPKTEALSSGEDGDIEAGDGSRLVETEDSLSE